MNEKSLWLLFAFSVFIRVHPWLHISYTSILKKERRQPSAPLSSYRLSVKITYSVPLTISNSSISKMRSLLGGMELLPAGP